MKWFKRRPRIKPDSQEFAIGDRVTLGGTIQSVSASYDGSIRYAVIVDDTTNGTHVWLLPSQILRTEVSDERG